MKNEIGGMVLRYRARQVVRFEDFRMVPHLRDDGAVWSHSPDVPCAECEAAEAEERAKCHD